MATKPTKTAAPTKSPTAPSEMTTTATATTTSTATASISSSRGGGSGVTEDAETRGEKQKQDKNDDDVEKEDERKLCLSVVKLLEKHNARGAANREAFLVEENSRLQHELAKTRTTLQASEDETKSLRATLEMERARHLVSQRETAAASDHHVLFLATLHEEHDKLAVAQRDVSSALQRQVEGDARTIHELNAKLDAQRELVTRLQAKLRKTKDTKELTVHSPRYDRCYTEDRFDPRTYDPHFDLVSSSVHRVHASLTRPQGLLCFGR